ncbi:alpha/beta hydrolase [Proteobacteria bacterium 005FR1]|nr:alpha/beta hydrolase [Proteobacteria bacterium 005FR1]
MNATCKRWIAALGSLMAGGVATALLLWQVSLEALPTETAAAPRGLQSVECWFAVPEDRDVDCAELHTDPERGGFTLPVVIIRDDSPDHRDDPLVYLSGGPGNSTFIERENVESWFYWADIARLSRDLILVDQRGTGLSRPRFHCHAYEEMVRERLRDNLTLEDEHASNLAVVEECVALMRTAGHSLEHYSTTQSALDMAELMAALDYKEWNVMGGSYGTRLALEWLRQQEQGDAGHGVRSVILDSVYPLDKGSMLEWPGLLNDSFDYFWKACDESAWCNTSGDQLRDRFRKALSRLRKNPVTLSVPLWGGGWPLKVVVNDHRFIGIVYTALYDDTLHTDIAVAIEEVLHGGEDALQKLAENSVNSELAPEFNPLVYLAVDCAESPSVGREEFELTRERFPQWSDYTDYAWSYDMCSPVPKRADLDSFRQAVETDVPALILSGGLDPVTPAAWARELAERLPNAQHWHLAQVGHGVVASNACVHQSFRAFLDAPNESHPLRCQH